MTPESLLGGPPTGVPLALARRHAALGVDDEVVVAPPRRRWPAGRLDDVVEGAGFRMVAAEPGRLVLRRALTLADTVCPAMRLLVCGLNPSVHAAEAGVGFARPGNRFWPAALAAGLVASDRDPWDALARGGVGMTDLVKRATPRAAELTAAEYRHGLGRVDRLVRWLRPGAACVVGLAGWRAAVDPGAGPGPQSRRLGGVPTYLMPSTSGLNAHSRLEDLTEHLRAAADLASRRPAGAPGPSRSGRE